MRGEHLEIWFCRGWPKEGGKLMVKNLASIKSKTYKLYLTMINSISSKWIEQKWFLWNIFHWLDVSMRAWSTSPSPPSHVYGLKKGLNWLRLLHRELPYREEISKNESFSLLGELWNITMSLFISKWTKYIHRNCLMNWTENFPYGT